MSVYINPNDVELYHSRSHKYITREYHNGPNGKVYGPEHYKKAIKYDKADLKKVNQRLKRIPKIQKKFMRFTAKTLTQVSKHSKVGRKVLDKIFEWR